MRLSNFTLALMLVAAALAIALALPLPETGPLQRTVQAQPAHDSSAA